MYEQGRREPSLGLIVCLAREFGVTTDYLLMGLDTKRENEGKRETIGEHDDHVEKLIECLLHVVARARVGVVKDSGGE
jgi:transcriptional regulator with XRE-family HTH domain